MRAIRRNDIRMVEVSATNVLDLLFLAGVLRRQCPDTRLVIRSADMLFVQAEQTQPLDGTLFLTSYPLFTESKLWEDRKQVLMFPDTLSEGIYNATVLLLTPQPQRLVADYAWPSVYHPAAWLMTLDRRGFSPVRVWANDASEDWWFQSVTGERPGPGLGSIPAPRSLSFLSIAFGLFSVGLCGWILRLHKEPDWIVDARWEPRRSGDAWHGFYLILFLLILIGIQIEIFAARHFYVDWPILILVVCGC